MRDTWTPTTLSSLVAVVTGSSRGVGRGIAQVLGQCGATVYVTGRSMVGSTTDNLPGTIDETACLVSKAGGKGIAVYCDHTKDRNVEFLFNRIQKEQGRLDLLVNNVWGGYEHYDGTFGSEFWKQPLQRWDGMFDAGVRAYFTASQAAARMMVSQKKGLMINISAGDKGKFLHATMYDTAKCAVDRLTFGMALEMKKYQVAALSLYPGFTLTERVQESVRENEDFDYSQTHSPQYVGRAVAYLAADPQVMKKSGQAFATGTLAKEYGFTDIDGRYIPAFTIPAWEG